MAQAEDDWCERALCGRPDSPVSPDLFFANRAEDRQPARELCKSCPVRLQCLSAALENEERWGVWGGCDEVDLRRALWSETPGTNRERVRYPRCPACRGKTVDLFVFAVCDLKNNKVLEAVECINCRFSWTAPSSVQAMKLFRAEPEQETKMADVVPLKVAVRVPRGKIPTGASGVPRLPSPQRKPERVAGVNHAALVASAEDHTTSQV